MVLAASAAWFCVAAVSYTHLDVYKRHVLPGIAVQLRGALANIHGALGRLAPEQLRDRDNRTDHSAAILCQSYYQILRVVNNLSDAPMLAEDKPFDTENVELVERCV